MRNIFPAVVIVIILLSILLFQVSKSRTFQFFGAINARIETDEKAVALTFDDGPTNENTDEILQILREENVKATFYLIGAEIEKNPGEIAKLIADGHEIGNHTFDHKRMVLVTPSFVKDEIERTDELIRKAGYTKEITFRPPFGKKLLVLPWFLSRTGRKTVTWDLEPETFYEKTDQIVHFTTENTKNGSIILLHVMYKSRAESMNAVRPIIKNLRGKGFVFKTVSELLMMKT